MNEIIKGHLLFSALFLFGLISFLNPFNLEMIDYVNKFGYGLMLMILAPIGDFCFYRFMKMKCRKDEQDGKK